MGIFRILEQFQSSARPGELEKNGAVLVGLPNEDCTFPVEAGRVPMLEVEPGPQRQGEYDQHRTQAVRSQVNAAGNDSVLVQGG